MTAIFLPLFAVLLFSFYLSLTTASVLPRDQSDPSSNCSSINTPAVAALNRTNSAFNPLCLRPYIHRNDISLALCEHTFYQISGQQRYIWDKPRYVWDGLDTNCTIVLKAEKLPPTGGDYFENKLVLDAAKAIMDSCVRGRGSGKGGSASLGATDLGTDGGQWRVWLMGKREDMTERDNLEADLDRPNISDITELPSTCTS